MTYDVLASGIFGKFTGEFKSNTYIKKSLNQINWQFKSNWYRSLNQINCNSLNQMKYSVTKLKCLKKVLNCAWILLHFGSYNLVLFLLFNISLALFQCFIIPPVLCRSAPLFRGVSIVPAVSRCSGAVPLFRRCSIVQGLFCVPVFRRCSVVPQVFRVPSFRVPVFLVL